MSRRLAPVMVVMQAGVAESCGLADGDWVSFTMVTPYGECRHVARVRVAAVGENVWERPACGGEGRLKG